MAFNQLCELLSDRLESGRPDTAPEVETPAVLQAFIQPWQVRGAPPLAQR